MVTPPVTTVTNANQGNIVGLPRERRALPSLRELVQQEDLNFLLTNRIPRRYLTLLMGWWSSIESPTLTRLSIAAWQLFADDLRLDEAKTQRFESLQECFTRELREGTRPVDLSPNVLVSPCDAVIGAHGRVRDGHSFQAKGFPYTLVDLLGDGALAARHDGALFVTLRLKSNMYHRFHAPADARLDRVRYLSGDTWNVNPIALKRVERLFCKNQRAVVELSLLEPGEVLTLVCVASILVASVEIHAARSVLGLRYDGPAMIECDGTVAKGDELGLFRSGSTIVLFASGPFEFVSGTHEGKTIRVGEALLSRTDSAWKGRRG